MDAPPASETTERLPSRLEAILDAIGPIDFIGLLSLTVATIGGAIVLVRRVVRLVRRRR